MPLFLHHYVLVFIFFIEVVCLCIEYICSSCLLYIIVPFFLSRSPQEPLLYIIYTAGDSLLLTFSWTFSSYTDALNNALYFCNSEFQYCSVSFQNSIRCMLSCYQLELDFWIILRIYPIRI